MQAVIFIGIQATGKTSFYKERFFTTHVRISLDLLRTRHREKAFLDTCLRTRQKFVVDNTNPTVEDRQRYIGPAKAAGFEVVGYFFDSNFEQAMARNRGRPGKEEIPAAGIGATHRKLQPPSLAEGFDRLYRVRIKSDGSFEVMEYVEEI